MSNHNIQGFTLIEMMISLTLGLFIMSMCVFSYMSIKRLSMMQKGMDRIQENAKIVHGILEDAIQSSESLGCEKINALLSVDISPDIDPIKYGLESNQNSNENEPNNTLKIISIKNPHRLKRKPSAFADHLLLHTALRLTENDILVLSDCHQAHFFRYHAHGQQGSHEVTHIKGDPHQFDAFRHVPVEALSVGKLNAIIYSVKITSRQNAHGDPVYALYEHDLNGRLVERCEGVEAMKIHSDDTNNSIKISVLLSSIEYTYIQPQWWHFAFQK